MTQPRNNISNISIETAQKLAIFYIKGHMSTITSDTLINHIKVHADGIDTIILDLEMLLSITSTGVGIICKLSLDMLKTVILVCPEENREVRGFITDVGLDDIVVVVPSISSALVAVAKKLDFDPLNIRLR